MSIDPEELDPSQRIIRHQPREKAFEPALGDGGNIENVSEHINRHIGEPEMVWHEIVSDLVHIDIHMVAPSELRPFYTLVTSGMSDRPMTLPAGVDGPRHAELMLCLPADWPLKDEDLKDERNYWPLRWMKILARLPHEYDTWLAFGHTVPNGDPAAPFADNTRFCCWMLSIPQTTPQDFWFLEVEGKKIPFYALIPLYKEEMEYKLRKGDALQEKLFKAGVTELIDLYRPNVCRRRFWLF